jgi:glycosyltransferase involved in cell wall biosynthesis
MSHSSKPMFSVVIPTRARPDTLRHALRTVTAQEDRTLEIIVHECGDDPATTEVLAGFDDPRIRFFKTGEQVRMTENWERALRQTTGDYLFFMGDDDGLLPNACEIARRILETHSGEILSWRPALYFWPDFFETDARNKIIAVYGTELECTLKRSRATLYPAYHFRQYYIELPMIYNSFVPRKLIERVYQSQDRYFIGSMADVVSGVTNLCYADQFLRCNRPLSLSGVSRHSTGHNFGSGKPELQSRIKSTAFGSGIPIHPTMVHSHSFPLAVGNELLIVKERLFPDGEPDFDYAAMLQAALQSLNDIPEEYDLVLEQCRSIAKRNGLTIDERDVVPPGPRPARPRPGRHPAAPGTILETVDGRAAAASNVFDATKILDGLLPKPAIDSSRFRLEPEQIEVIALGPDATTLDFSSTGNGAILLGLGWSDIESWGVWSDGPRSELFLPLSGEVCGPVRISIHGQLFHPPRKLRLLIEHDSLVLFEHESFMEGEAVALELGPITLPGNVSSIRLRTIFAVDHCDSPAELGLSADTRKLGFGLYRIEISFASNKPSTSLP